MWMDPRACNAYKDLCLVSCEEHREKVIEREKFPDLSNELQRLFWLLKRHTLEPFLGDGTYHDILNVWIKKSEIPNLRQIVSMADGYLLDSKAKLSVIDSVSTLYLYSLLKICVTCLEIFDEVDIYSYFHHVFETKHKDMYHLANNTDCSESISNLKNVPGWENIRKRFESSDENLISLGVLVSYYYFVNTLNDIKDNILPYPSHQYEMDKLAIKGDEYLSKKNYASAIDCYTASLKAQPSNAKVHYKRSECYIMMNKFVHAELNSRFAVSLDFKCPKAYCNLSEALNIQSQMHDAHLVSEFGLKCSNKDDPNYLALQELSEVYRSGCNACSSVTDFERKLTEDVTKLPEKVTNISEEVTNLPEEVTNIPEEVTNLPEEVTNLPEEVTNLPEEDMPELVSSSDEEENNPNRKKFKKSILEGSTALLDNTPNIAKLRFQKALDIIKSSKPCAMNKFDLSILKYSYAVSCSNLASYEDSSIAISYFKQLIEEHSQVYPAAYYRLALTYYNMNYFKDAMNCLKTIPAELYKDSTLFKPLKWLGTDKEIIESDFKIFMERTKDLEKKCECPPPADGFCRYESCTLQTAIYLSDNEFRGFISIHCTERCTLQFHMICWKSMKESLGKSEKDFLNTPCYTPDCSGLFTVVKVIGKNGNEDRRFESEDVGSKKSTTKQKKTKLEKKFEIKEMKKQKQKQRSVSLCDNSEKSKEEENSSEGTAGSSMTSELPQVPHVQSKFSDTKKFLSSESVPNAVTNAKPEVSDSSQPLYVIRKEAENKPAEAKSGKHDKKKKQKKPVLSVEEFCGDYSTQPDISNCTEYQLRLHRLQESKRVIEEKAFPLLPTPHFSDLQSQPVPCTQPSKSVEGCTSGLDDIESSNTDSDPLRDQIYKFFEDILATEKKIKLDDSNIQLQLEAFPPEWKEYIEKKGGLKPFLLQNVIFGLVGDTLCYFTVMLELYNTNGNNTDTLQEVDFMNDSAELSDPNAEGSLSNLNPNAAEYSPSMSDSNSEKNCCSDSVPKSRSRNSSGQSLRQRHHSNNRNVAVNTFQQMDSSTDQPLLTVLSDLRKPLSNYVEPTKDNKVSDNTDVTDPSPSTVDVEFDMDDFTKKLEILQTSLINNPTSKNIMSLLTDLCAMLKTSSNGDIQQHLGKLNLIIAREEKSIQAGTPAADLVSQGVMKEDHELQTALTQLKDLMIKCNDLNDKKKILEQQVVAARDREAKLQSKLSVDIPALEKQLEDYSNAKKEEIVSLKNKVNVVEKDVKLWRQKSDDLTTKLQDVTKENEKLVAKNKRYCNENETLEKKREEYFEKLDAHSIVVERYTNIMRENQETIEKAHKDVITERCRARKAEVELLSLQKSKFGHTVEGLLKECYARLQYTQKWLLQSCNTASATVTYGMTTYMGDLKKYIEYLAKILDSTKKKVDVLLESIQKDSTTLEQANLVFENIPPIPDISKYVPQTQPVNTYSPQIGLPPPPPPPPALTPAYMMPQGLNYTPMPYGNAPKGFSRPGNLDFFQKQYMNKLQSPVTTSPPYVVTTTTPPPLTAAANLDRPEPANWKNPWAAAAATLTVEEINGKDDEIDDVLNEINEKQTNDNEDKANGTCVDVPIEPPPLSDSSSGSEGSSSSGDEDCTASSYQSLDDRASTEGPLSAASPMKSIMTTAPKDVPATEKFDNGSTGYWQIVGKQGKPNPWDPIGTPECSRFSPEKPQEKVTGNQPKAGVFLGPSNEIYDPEAASAKTKSCLPKLFSKLQSKYPQLTQSELAVYVSKFRATKVRLTGMAIEAIVNGVVEIIERDTKSKQPAAPLIRPKGTVKALPRAAPPESSKPARNPFEKNPWSRAADNNNESTPWTGNGDKSCTICLEDMAPNNSITCDCGHKFHYVCIKQWLDKTSNCPTCRVHLLLPEDYPKLR